MPQKPGAAEDLPIATQAPAAKLHPPRTHAGRQLFLRFLPVRNGAIACHRKNGPNLYKLAPFVFRSGNAARRFSQTADRTEGGQQPRSYAAPQLRCPAATWRTTETWPERLRGINSQLKVFCFSPSTYWATVHPMAGRLRRPRIGCTCIRRIRRTQRCACKLWVDAVRGQCRTAPQFRNRLDPFS